MTGAERRAAAAVGLRRIGVSALAVLGLGVPVAAQTPPPAPLPARPVHLPPVQERTLSGGARLMVVTEHEMPFVTVSLVLPAGRTEDPPGQEGLSDLTAALLTRGTTTRSATEIEEAVESLGAELGASASADWTTVTASAVTSDLPEVVDLMADVVLHPAFPPHEVEALRERAVAALAASLGQPSILADRQFLRAIYGDHPYGRLETPESVGAVDRASIVTFHETWFRPGRALFVVAGDVDADGAAALVEGAFQGWEPATLPEIGYGPPPERTGPEVFLVHRPGARGASIRVGELLPPGDDPDWTTLSTVNQILGGSSRGRLFGALRQETGAAVEAHSQVQRRLERGFFRASAEVPAEVVRAAVEEILAQIVRMTTRTVGPEELRDARDFLVGSFPLQVETAQQVASQLTTARLLGVPDSALSTYPRRVSRASPEDLREVAARHLRPDRLVYVVVGDASRLHGQLTTFGRVQVVDEEGSPLDATALLPRRRSEPLDASSLAPLTVEYRVSYQGQVVGRVARTLEEGEAPGTMVYRGTADLGPQTATQSVTFTVPGFEAVAASAHIESMGQSRTLTVEVREGRVVGRVEGPDGARELSQPLPPGAVVGDMAELVIWIADLAEGKELSVPGLQPETGAVENVPYRVGGVEEITVPAGTFPAYRVEIGGSQAQTVWARVEAPHVLLKIEPSGQPVVLELASATGGG